MHDDGPRSEPPNVQVGVTFTGSALAFAEAATKAMAINPAVTIPRDRGSVGAAGRPVCAVAHTKETAG
jgi:hypothetical protein